MYLEFVLILSIIILYLNQNNLIENFNAYQTFQSYFNFPLNTYKFPFYPLINPSDSPYYNGYYIPMSNGYTNFPWLNTALGNTSNMSYDVRGDPLIIPRTNFVWNNGTNFPIYN